MNRDKPIRELRAYVTEKGRAFSVGTKKGKGSHYLVKLGDKVTTVQSDINEGRAQRIRKQLEVA